MRSGGAFLALVGLVAVVAAAAAMGTARPAHACATAPPQDLQVAVAAESAIIIWDDATKTEHFIRRATFQAEGPGRDFGFLVPTPTKPELNLESSDIAEQELTQAIRPEVIHEKRSRIEPTAFACFWMFSRSMKSEAPSLATAPATAPVRILEEKRVGDYDAVVLEADDAGALGEWLNTHRYTKRPALEEWLKTYVDKKWKLTAFKIADDVLAAAAAAPDGGASGANAIPPPMARRSPFGTKAVRMSFKTERPFFPYREPRDQRESVPASLSTPRSLRVFYLGPHKVDAQVGEGEGANTPTTKFAGKIAWAGPLKREVADKMPLALPAGTWLTAIEDDSSPRPGVDELYLDRAKDQTPVKPPPIVVIDWQTIPLPLDVVVFFGVGIFLIVRRVRRVRGKKSSNEAAS